VKSVSLDALLYELALDQKISVADLVVHWSA